MTYRVYVRWPNSKVSDKTVTEDRALAEMAYQRLIARKDLIGKSAGVAFTYSSGGKPQNVAYYDFDHPLDSTASVPSEAPAAPARPTMTLKKTRDPS